MLVHTNFHCMKKRQPGKYLMFQRNEYMDLKLNEGVYIMTDFIRMLFMAQMVFVNIGLLGSVKFVF